MFGGSKLYAGPALWSAWRRAYGECLPTSRPVDSNTMRGEIRAPRFTFGRTCPFGIRCALLGATWLDQQLLDGKTHPAMTGFGGECDGRWRLGRIFSWSPDSQSVEVKMLYS